MWAIDSERRNDHVHARAVRQAGIDHWRGLIHVPADSRDNFVDDVHQMSIIFEADVSFFQNPSPFYIDLLMPIHQDVVNTWVLQKRFQGA